VVEQGPVEQILSAPKSEYTKELLRDVPVPQSLPGQEQPFRSSLFTTE
jgi:ABC-type dipeptide/oligopeptide/nickel transport system ATPase component